MYGEPLDVHHIFGGPNRSLSDKYGLTVYLHHNSCHIFGKNSVHTNKEVREKLQAEAQKMAMEYYGWDVNEWIKIFGMNYLPMSEDESEEDSDAG